METTLRLFTLRGLSTFVTLDARVKVKLQFNVRGLSKASKFFTIAHCVPSPPSGHSCQIHRVRTLSSVCTFINDVTHILKIFDHPPFCVTLK